MMKMTDPYSRRKEALERTAEDYIAATCAETSTIKASGKFPAWALDFRCENTPEAAIVAPIIFAPTLAEQVRAITKYVLATQFFRDYDIMLGQYADASAAMDFHRAVTRAVENNWPDASEKAIFTTELQKLRDIIFGLEDAEFEHFLDRLETRRQKIITANDDEDDAKRERKKGKSASEERAPREER
ncbi:MAG: hypothetical protein Q4C86_06200 [bacterium]|nr:hypothetical protein [bacterium]